MVELAQLTQNSQVPGQMAAAPFFIWISPVALLLVAWAHSARDTKGTRPNNRNQQNAIMRKTTRSIEVFKRIYINHLS